MKIMRKHFFVVFIVAILSLLLAVSESKAEVSYLGEVCLNLTSLYNVPDKTVQLGILSYGAGYFSLNGKITDEISRIMPISGTAIITEFEGDNTVVLTLTAAYNIYSETYYITFDLKTLSGWFSSIVHEPTFIGPTPDQIVSRYDSGEAILVVCPK